MRFLLAFDVVDVAAVAFAFVFAEENWWAVRNDRMPLVFSAAVVAVDVVAVVAAAANASLNSDSSKKK